MPLTQARPYEGGLTRRRRGRGWSYAHADGTPVTDADVRSRIDDLVIPPAWKRVWISTRERDHIQAVGYDDAGRRQYVYHPQWHAERHEEKYDRVLSLARRLPRFRADVESALASRGTGHDRVLGAAMRILDLGVFRTGGEAYAEENGTHGLATLLRSHVRMRENGLEFSYTAKGGLHRRIRIRDAGLVRFTRALRRARPDGERFLVHRDGGGAWHEVHSDDINTYFKGLTGDEFTAKDLRTWNGTVVAAVAFADLEQPTTRTARRKAEASAMRTVSQALGNTPAVARGSYVDPRVVAAFDDGATIAPGLRRARRASSETEMRAGIERAVVRLLEKAG